MKEKTLLKIALICSFLGLFILYIVSENVVIEESTIDKIDEIDFEDDVKVKGVVDKVVDADKVYIIDIVQPGKISVVLFKDENISISEGDMIEVIGELDEYDGKLEVIGNRVRVIR